MFLTSVVSLLFHSKRYLNIHIFTAFLKLSMTELQLNVKVNS